MMNTLLMVVVVSLIVIQVFAVIFSRERWNILVNVNSIGIKLLLVFLLIGIGQEQPYMFDIVLILMVLNVVGTIIYARFFGRN